MAVTILDLDIGNSRLKWLLRRDNGELADRGSIASDQSSLKLFSTLPTTIRRVRVSSVRRNLHEELQATCMALWGVEPEYAVVRGEYSGLKCGYRQPSMLGVDRWMALLAVWHTPHRKSLVVDAGSALTIDILDGNCHLGGYIVPGYRLMISALGLGTEGVQVTVKNENLTEPGRETVAAVNNGVRLLMAAGVATIAESHGINEVIITGGDGQLLMDTLSKDLSCHLIPNLVFDGLQVALP